MAAGVPPAPPGPGDRKSRRLPAGLLLATVIALVLLGAVYVTYEIRQMRAEAGAQLAAVAELKAAQIENWLGERRADTGVLARSPFLFDDAGHLVPPDPSGAAPAKLAAYLERVRTAYGYSSVAFFDSGLRPVVAVPRSSAPADAAETELLRAAWRAGGVVTGELVRTGAGPVLLDFVAPVFSADGTTPAGAVRLRMDAGAHLFPLLARWPSPSETAESILFRREGDSLAYLSPLRHRPGAASGLRLPLSQASLLAAAAVLDPRADAIEGVTYRGVRGLAVARPVSGTPWKLIAQVDLSEAYGPARDEALRLVVGLALVLALALLAVSLLWRERHFDLLRRERDAERARLETAERLALVLRHANDAILLVADDLRLVEANDRASVLYGYAPDELLRLSVSDLRAAETSAALADDLAATRQAGGRVFETIHRRKDGTAFPVEVSSRPVEIGGRPHLLALLRDISERKEHERQLERLNRMYLALSRVGEAIVHATDDAALAGSVCRILVEAGGFTLTWVGRLDTSGALVPQAQAGDDTGYVEGIRVSVDTSPEGRGPAGTAFREGRPVVVNDFLADPTTAPWRERAEKSGLRSSIALPLYRLGSATGALMIYAGEKDTFGEAEIALAEEVAGNLSFAFDVLARDEERRAAEQALRVREEVFSSIVGQALDAIALVDAGTGRFVEFNEAAHRNLGYSREDFAGLGIDDIQAGQSRDETGLVIGKMLGLGSADFETRHRHRSGAIRSVHVRARLLTLQERPHIAAVWTDITERKGAELERQQAQEALRENEARLNEAQRIAHIGVWELDHHRDRRIWSDEMYRIFGVPPNALAATSETFLGFIHPEDRERAVTSFAASLAHRAAYEIDYRLLLRDGSVKQVHERCETWFDEAGTPLRSFGTVQDVTAHHQAEARLRQLSSAVEQSPVSIVITDLTGAIEYVNPYFSLVTGYDFEEVRGQNPRVLKSGKTPEASYVEMWRTLVAGQVWRGELHNRKKNGETFPEQAVIAPIAGQDGRVTHYVAIKEDITERKRSDDALRDSESRFRRLFEAAPVPLCVVQGATGVLNLNERFVETFGYTGADLATIDDWWLRAYPDAARRAGYRQSWDAALATALERGSDVPPMEVRVTCRRGEERTILIAGAPLGTGLLVSLFDVTEREAAEAALLAKQARLEEAQALALLGSWERDLHAGTLVRSPEIHGIFERDASCFGTSTDDFFAAVHPEDREWVLKAYTDSFRSPVPREIDHRIVVADGRVKWVRARWRTELGPDGTPVRAAGTIQDITDHVLAREARSLAEAKEIAESANRAKSAFLASMSHEIRTPMNSILGFSQLLLGDPGLTDRQQEQLRAISRSGEHLLGLIDDVLEMSKIEAGRVTANPAECDLLDLLWDLESMFRVRAQERGLDVRIDREPNLPRHVVTDERKLRQILINLMGNAVKFTSTGGLTVRVSARPASGSLLHLHVDVADTGPGISEEELPRLFQRFEQTRSGREASSGTGLGLAISRGFARLMGGDIRVRSRLGEGSVFSLSLPVSLSTAHVVAEKAGPRRVSGLPAGETRRRILVADDVEENREILRQMLGRVGFVVRTATDGRQTLELFSTWRPDLVLMDLRMPGMDGLEATRSIRAAEGTGRTPIIAVTASAFEEDRRQVELAGGDGFVSKPFREAELIETVGRTLGVRYVFEDEATPPGAPEKPVPPGTPSVPDPFRTALRAAVVSADLDRVRVLANELAGIDPDAAVTVRELAEQFEYDRLLALLAPGAGERPVKPGSTAFGETGAIEESQKRTLERLREAEQRWQFALEGSGDGVWDWNPATGETYFSPRFKELLGYGKDELDASVEAWNSRMHPEDGEKFSLHLDRHLEGVTPGYEVEHRLLCRDGTYRWFETRGLVLERDAEGRPSRVIGTARDVTARREAEERLRLSHDRLQAANLELARAARMKDEFLASMSHELRTPLGAVLGMATLLKEQVHGPLPPESLRQVEVIRTSGEHLLGLLNDVLDVARIDAGRLEARLAPCFLSEVGEACLRRIGRAAAEKGLEVALVVDPPGLVVETDGPLLSKLLGGLLSNAVKFTPSGGRIGLELTRDEAAGVARIVVRDTGIGISPENLGKLFETFTQLDGRTERLYGGTGLGLALVRRLARLLGGTISVQSELDRGTRFLLTLPCRPGGSEAEAEAGPLPVPGAPSTPPGSFDPRPAAGADLSGRLPEGLRSALGSAIRQADLEQVDELTRKLVEEDPETARFVLRLARDFEYERLLALLGTPGGFGPGQDPSKAED